MLTAWAVVHDFATFRIDGGGKERSTLKAGDHFGEAALIDRGARTATIVAATELACYRLTYWDFRPFVEQNGAIGRKLRCAIPGKASQGPVGLFA